MREYLDLNSSHSYRSYSQFSELNDHTPTFQMPVRLGNRGQEEPPHRMTNSKFH